jgi:hypothetical protein
MITAERLRELVHYCPETGVFTHLQSKGRKKAGMRAGWLRKDGYIETEVDGKAYKAHRLAWLYTYGAWPIHHIDHIDGNRSNNRLINLRDVNRFINSQNQRLPCKINQCGFLGVHKHGPKFRAQIRVKGKNKHLGLFDTAELAHEAYLRAKRVFHEGCTI